MRFSSSFKVGLLTIISLIILVLSILWIKGRALSTATRITVNFKDANGMRPGNGVQLMGLRVGQVEEVTPVINDENSYIKIKFVITEKNVSIPLASSVSIQQSGLIGEQFLEITPPQVKTLYIAANNSKELIHSNNDVVMNLGNEKNVIVGHIENVEVIKSNLLPNDIKENIRTNFAYKVNYLITMPGLILPYEEISGKIIKDKNHNKLMLFSINNEHFNKPQGCLKYTVIEPLRLSDFMDLQYRSAQAFTETNTRLAQLLSDDVIIQLKESVDNIRILTQTANTTLEKAQLLIDNSRQDLNELMQMANEVSDKIIILTDNLNEVVGDETFKTTLTTTAQSVNRLSMNLNSIIEDPTTKQTMENIKIISSNLSQISSYVNDATTDPQLKENVNKTVSKLNTALDELAITLNTVNTVTASDKCLIKRTIDDVSQTASNLKKFSTKLNKRFLLFRLMF